MKSYYEILEISETANEEEIKKAFRKQAMKWHPDRNPGNKDAEEKFKEMKSAYDVLSDPYKRKQYDFSRKSETKKEHTKQNTNQNYSNQASHDNQQTISNLIVTVDFWEAVFGCNKTFEFINPYNTLRQLVTITVPAGTNDDEEFLVEVNGSKLHITIKTKFDDFFTRNNLDLFTHIELPFTMAALGGKLIFPHWDGDLEVLVPPGIKPNQTLLLANKGVKRNIFIGDLYLICNISVPKKLTPKQKLILEEFKKTETGENNGAFDRFKDTWKSVFKPD